MASRRFFAYDPYDYYYTTPYHYPYPYHQQQAAPAHRCSGFFPVAADAEPAAVRRAAAVDTAPRARSVLIPVHFVGSDPEAMPERKAAALRAEPVARTAVVPVNVKRAPSAEEAAVRVQAAARGFMARRSVRAVREVEREAAEAGGKIAREAEALRGDARARVAIGEALMRMLLRLDAVHGAREYRRRVTKRVLALQDAVDALEPKPAPVAAAEENEPGTATAETPDESAVASELPDVVERSAEIKAKAAAGMEVDGGRAGGEQEEVEEAEQAQDDGNLVDGDKPEGSGAVTEEPEPAAAPASRSDAPGPQEPAGAEIRTTEMAAGCDGGQDTRKLMEMVAALCEQSAQQCTVIGALADRVDALEHAVRRAEDAERRQRRSKKLRKEGKGSSHSKCYSD